jgi:hypothetical protein
LESYGIVSFSSSREKVSSRREQIFRWSQGGRYGTIEDVKNQESRSSKKREIIGEKLYLVGLALKAVGWEVGESKGNPE